MVLLHDMLDHRRDFAFEILGRTGDTKPNIQRRIPSVSGNLQHIVDARIHPQVMGSDHCPVELVLQFTA